MQRQTWKHNAMVMGGAKQVGVAVERSAFFRTGALDSTFKGNGGGSCKAVCTTCFGRIVAG